MFESNSTTYLQIDGDIAAFVESDSDEVDDALMLLVLMLLVVMTVWLTVAETFDGTFRCCKVCDSAYHWINYGLASAHMSPGKHERWVKGNICQYYCHYLDVH